jgi:hypothetical protein
MLKTAMTLGASSKSESKVELSPFAKKWAQIEKKQKRNDNFKIKREALYETFKKDVLPKEQQYCEAIGTEVRHLLTFMPHKSLTQWQRDELLTWIENDIEALTSNPFCDPQLAHQLRVEYSNTMMQTLVKAPKDRISEQELDELRMFTEVFFGDDKTFTQEQLETFLRDPAQLKQLMMDYTESKVMDDNIDEDDETASDGSFEFHDDTELDDDTAHEQQHGRRKQKYKDSLKSMFDGSQLNKIYKLLANKLHPDKESDPQLKAERSELMSELAKAKKKQDGFTIIQMFQQYLPEKAAGFSPDLTESMRWLLNVKMHELDTELNELKSGSDLPGMIWQRLGANSKKKINDNLQHHLQDIITREHDIDITISEIQTVKTMKQYLTELYEDNNYGPYGFDVDYHF